MQESLTSDEAEYLIKALCTHERVWHHQQIITGSNLSLYEQIAEEKKFYIERLERKLLKIIEEDSKND